MADNPNNPRVSISHIDPDTIRDLANAISEQMGEYTKELGAIAKMSRGPGGLGVSRVSEEAQLRAQQNIRGFSGGSMATLSGAIAGYDPKAAWMRWGGKKDDGTPSLFSQGVSHEEHMALERKARGLSAYGTGQIDPALFGGQMSLARMLAIGGDFANKRAGATWSMGDDLAKRMRTLDTAATLQRASDYAPMASHAYQNAQRAYRYGQGLTSMAERQGFSSAGDDITIPGTNIGFKSPLNPAAMRGIQEVMGRVGNAFSTAGLNQEQAAVLQSQMISQGYVPGVSPGSNQMQAAMQRVATKNSFALASNPDALQLMDASMRFQGNNANDSLNKMVSTISRIGPVAQAASMSMDQVASGMNNFVQTAMKGGATPTQAAQTYMGQLASTGIDPNLLQGMDKNSMVMAKYAQMGIKPWQIASATASEKNTAQMGGIKQMYESFGGRGVPLDSAQGQEILQRIKAFNPTLPSTPVLSQMLKEDPKKLAGRTRAQSINESYGAGARDQQTGALLPGRKDYQNMSDAQRDNVLAQIESTAGLTKDQKKILNDNLGADKNQWQGKIDAALTAVARNEDVSQAMKNSNNPLGNANASDLLKRAVDSLSQLRDVVNKVEPGYN